MCEMVTLTLRKEDITDAVMDGIVKVGQMGTVTFDEEWKKMPGKTWMETLESETAFTNRYITNQVKEFCGMADTKLIDSVILNISMTSHMGYEELAQVFAPIKTHMTFWFEDCDGYNPTELILYPNGKTLMYDVDKTDGTPIVDTNMLHAIRHYPSQAFKTITLGMLELAGFNDEDNPSGLNPLKEMRNEHTINQIIGMLDEQEVTIDEASKRIVEFKQSGYANIVARYIITIPAEFSAEQAILPESESEDYVDLPDAHDLYIGIYRGVSAEDAINRCVQKTGIDESILHAEYIS